MSKSLLFIPDISGFTHFVQTTEVEHSQHVIAELLEVLIAANSQNLKLAEIEGDALFFYKENSIPSQEKLLAQIESMFTAFYSHLNLLEKHRVCPCNACATAPKLQLKIVVHAGDLQFINVQNNRKPFGESVIQAHRLLKNSVASENYALLSNEVVESICMVKNYESMLFSFRESVDTYDNIPLAYTYSVIDNTKLNLTIFPEGIVMTPKNDAKLEIERRLPYSAKTVLEFITNYKYRYLWAVDAEKVEWNENQVTRLGSEHTCTIGGKQLNFIVITKEAKSNGTVYGELTTSPSPVDNLYQFFEVSPVSAKESVLKYEVYWEAKSPIKKLMLTLVGKRALIKNSKQIIKELETQMKLQMGSV